MTEKERLAELVREAKEKHIYSDEIAQYLIDRGVVVLRKSRSNQRVCGEVERRLEKFNTVGIGGI